MAGPIRKKRPRQSTPEELQRGVIQRLVLQWKLAGRELRRILRGDPYVPSSLEMTDKIKDEDKLYFLGYHLDRYVNWLWGVD